MQSKHLSPSETTPSALPPDAEAAQWVSAMVDGELPSEAFSVAWTQCRESEAAEQAWYTQQLAGEVLRGELNAGAMGLEFSRAQVFAKNVVLLAKAMPAASDAHGETAHSHLAVEVPRNELPVAGQPARLHAANDSLFRWKAVAGLASLSAVLSVAWNVWGGSGDASSQLAQAPAAPSVTVAATGGTPPQANVLVLTGNGVMERNAQLDALIQAHRQHGGGTAWQVPAGFMRAATHGTPSQP